jgi:DNA (cytosine-5)-methyltransferase 1
MLTVLDLFCGAGGLSKGFELAGFKILGGIDFNPDAIKTHEFNFPESISICEDMSKISDERITNIFSDQIDVIIGGPP